MNYAHKYSKYKIKYLQSKNPQTTQLTMDSTTEAFIDSIKDAQPIYTLEPVDARKVLNKVAKSNDKLPVHTEDVTIMNNISIRIIRPIGSECLDLMPIVMYFHGGGWILGNEDTHDRFIREIAVGANVAVVFVNFSPAPEKRFPTQILEAYDATVYMYEHANGFGLDADKLIVTGDSVGGNMAIAVTLMARESHKINIIYQILIYPVCDAQMDTPSYDEYANGPWLTKNAMEWFYDAYEPNVDNRRNILISPINADLHGLPPALVITNEYDVLRDEGEAYAHKLIKAGIEVQAVRMLGSIHDCLILEPLRNTPVVKGAILLITSQLKNILQL